MHFRYARVRYNNSLANSPPRRITAVKSRIAILTVSIVQQDGTNSDEMNNSYINMHAYKVYLF